MAIVSMPSHVDGDIYPAADYMKLKGNIEDLDARLGNVLSSNTAHSRLTALETLTGASGATAAGNAALSSRLGTGVTTSNTATSQFSAVNSSLTSQGNRISALETPSSSSPGGGPWIYVSTLTNGWVNRSSIDGATWQDLRMRWLPGGNVQVEGVIKRSAGGVGTNSPLFTISTAAMRPGKDQIITIFQDSGVPCGIRLYPNGDCNSYVSGTTTSVLLLNFIFPSVSAGT